MPQDRNTQAENPHSAVDIPDNFDTSDVTVFKPVPYNEHPTSLLAPFLQIDKTLQTTLSVFLVVQMIIAAVQQSGHSFTTIAHWMKFEENQVMEFHYPAISYGNHSFALVNLLTPFVDYYNGFISLGALHKGSEYLVLPNVILAAYHVLENCLLLLMYMRDGEIKALPVVLSVVSIAFKLTIISMSIIWVTRVRAKRTAEQHEWLQRQEHQKRSTLAAFNNKLQQVQMLQMLCDRLLTPVQCCSHTRNSTLMTGQNPDLATGIAQQLAERLNLHQSASAAQYVPAQSTLDGPARPSRGGMRLGAR